VNATLTPLVNRFPFEDGAEYADVITILDTNWTGSPAKNSAAAKLGWWWRRGLVAPDAWKVFRAAVNAADPCALRLWLCDQAEDVQSHFQDKYPGDGRLLAVIEAGRQYARGEIGDKERHVALKPIRALLAEQVAVQMRGHWQPHEAAIQAAAFTTAKSLLRAARSVLDWAEEVENPQRTRHMDLEGYAELVSARFVRTEA
jgi:hypothetical protein